MEQLQAKISFVLLATRSLKNYFTNKMSTKIDFDPNTNANVISIIKQPDGNWIGYTQKNGKTIEVRQGDPGTVLQLLITHP